MTTHFLNSMKIFPPWYGGKYRPLIISCLHLNIKCYREK